MIKRIIFDLDNTLIDWTFYDEEKKLLEKIMPNFNPDIHIKFLSALGDYEKKYKRYDNDILLKHINKITDSNFDKNFMNKWLEGVSGFVPDIISSELKETLEYLSSKYDLVVLTNFFTEPAINRLKKSGLLKYFTKIYGSEVAMKPYKESYLNAIDDYKIEECLMIGDDLNNDVIGPTSIGMRAIHYDRNNVEHEYPKIKNIKELKEML